MCHSHLPPAVPQPESNPHVQAIRAAFEELRHEYDLQYVGEVHGIMTCVLYASNTSDFSLVLGIRLSPEEHPDGVYFYSCSHSEDGPILLAIFPALSQLLEDLDAQLAAL